MEHAGIASGTTLDYLPQFPWILTDANTHYTVTQVVSAMLPIPWPSCYMISAAERLAITQTT